jgi:hypothetical protein
VVTPTEPGTLIGRGKQGLDFRTSEKMHLCSRISLARNGQNTLDLGGMVRRFECGIPEKRVNGGQPQIATARAQASMFFQVIEKSRDQRCVERLKREPVGRRMQLLLREL